MPEPGTSCGPNCLHCHLIREISSHFKRHPEKGGGDVYVREMSWVVGEMIGYALHGARKGGMTKDEVEQLKIQLIDTATHQIDHYAMHLFQALSDLNSDLTRHGRFVVVSSTENKQSR